MRDTINLYKSLLRKSMHRCVIIRGGLNVSLCHIIQKQSVWLYLNISFRYDYYNKKLIRKWDSERELSVRRHRTRTTKYNRLVHSATDRRGVCVERMFTKFSEITQCNGHYTVQGHSRVTDFGTNRKLIYDFLLVINSNLPPILRRFQVMAQFSLARGECLTLSLSPGVIPC